MQAHCRILLFFCLAILCNQVPSGDQEVALHGDDKVAVDNYVKVSISSPTDK